MIAICIGHSRKIGSRYDGGAYSPHLGINERDFNLKLASKLSAKLTCRGIPSKIFDHYDGRGYGSAMADVARQVKNAGCTVAIELHFNSATPSANGHEWLYWHSSVKGKAIAEKFERCFSRLFPGSRSRGVKPITRNDRGGKFLELTHCPAIILEPFFGSNEADCERITIDTLAEAYANALS